MPENVKPEYISAIAAILAKGFLRYRKSRRLWQQNGLDSDTEQSVHVTVVNDQRTDEN